MAKIKITNQAEPSTPAAGTSEIYIDSTSKVLSTKDDAGVIRTASSYTHPNHSGEVTSTADGAQVMGSTYISNKSEVTAAVGDHVPIIDLTDGALKKVTIQTITDLVSVSTPAWTTATVTVNDGGTLTYDTTYSRYYITGKLLYWEFAIVQTAAGTGTTACTIDVPGSATLVDSECAGTAMTFDLGNDGVYRTCTVEAIASSNKFQVAREATTTYIRGGHFAGNNGVLTVACNIVCEIA